MRACPRCRSAYVGEIEFCGIDGARIEEMGSDPLLGATIDRYRVVELVGRGAMGSVYRARHATLDRDFAVKVLFGDLASNRTFAGRFRREAQALSKLRHTNIISVSDFGETDAGLTYLVMDYVEGTTLAQVIRREGSFSAWRTARFTRQIASALAEAHRCGLIHRDVKPENVFVIHEGEEEILKLLDFGIVAIDDDPQSTKLTGMGRIVGTPTYMAPEQARQGPITHHADLYSLGVMVYEMLTGKPPFDGSVTELLVLHALEPAPELRGYGGLEEITQRLLQKNPIDRYDSAAALISEIDALVIDWSGVGGELPIEAIARSISVSGLRAPTIPGTRPISSSSPPITSRSTPRGGTATVSTPPRGNAPISTLEIDGPPPASISSSVPSLGVASLVEDLLVDLPPPSISSSAEDLLRDAHTPPPPSSSGEGAPPYDPFLQPDPYYSNLMNEKFDGLMPESVVNPSSRPIELMAPAQWAELTPSVSSESGPFPQPLGVQKQETPVELMAPSLSGSLGGGSQSLIPPAEKAHWWQRLGPLLVALSLLISMIALLAVLFLLHNR